MGAALRDDPRTNPPQQRDDWVMWGLTDPWQATRIVMDTSTSTCASRWSRAVAVGERVSIYSDHPEQWLSLAQPNIAVVQRCGTPDFVPPSWSTTGRPRRRRSGCSRR